MANKVGPLIKEARTNAGFTQEALAKKLKTVTAAEISKAERGELELPQTTLKEIAKLTGVTQVSLIEAAKKSTYTAKKPAAATAGKKPASTSAKKPAASSTGTLKLSAAETKLVQAYRKADSGAKKTAMRILQGEKIELMEILPYMLEGMNGANGMGGLGSLFGSPKRDME